MPHTYCWRWRLCLRGADCPAMKTGLNYHRLILLPGLLSSLTPEGRYMDAFAFWVIHCHTNILIVVHFFPLQKLITFEWNNGSNYLSAQEPESNSTVINTIARYPCSNLSYSYGIRGSRDWSQAVLGCLWHKPTSLGVCVAGGEGENRSVLWGLGYMLL